MTPRKGIDAQMGQADDAVTSASKLLSCGIKFMGTRILPSYQLELHLLCNDWFLLDKEFVFHLLESEVVRLNNRLIKRTRTQIKVSASIASIIQGFTSS